LKDFAGDFKDCSGKSIMKNTTLEDGAEHQVITTSGICVSVTKFKERRFF
jgi:hypothetical protein